MAAIRRAVTLIVLASAVVVVPPVGAGLMFEASLKNGDYGGGQTIDTMSPDHGGSPHALGIADATDGVTFTPTEPTNTSNGVIYYQPGAARNSFRAHGTISMQLYGDREAHAGMTRWGALWGENYGWTAFRHGQGTFSSGSSYVANGEGPGDDQMRITFSTWHNNVWYTVGEVFVGYGKWHHIGFAWGGPGHDYEIWVDRQLRSTFDLPSGVSFPWGTSNSGANWGLGGLHERGYGSDGNYNSVVGVTYADLRLWDEYRPEGDTVPEPGVGALILVGGCLGLLRRTR